MINISKENAFNKSYIHIHQKNVVKYISDSRGSFSFFDYDFSTDEAETNKLIMHIAFDPFSVDNLTQKNTAFLNDYKELSAFLLYSPTYFDVLKQQHRTKRGKEYLTYLHDARSLILHKFKENHILKKLGIEDECLAKTKNKYNEFYSLVKDKFSKNNESISMLFDYDDFIKKTSNIRSEILRNINITVCPYCNRQYVDRYSHGGKVRSVAHIDHFFPKSIFPLYSLSLLNFVPSCSHCNCIIKRDFLFPWKKIYTDSPRNEKYFHVDFTNFNGFFGDVSGFKIKITPSNDEDRNNCSFFKHEAIYNNHKEDVAFLLKKRSLYSNGYKTAIEKSIHSKLSDEEFKKIIFGSSSEEDLYKIPLSKIKNDILDDILHGDL